MESVPHREDETRCRPVCGQTDEAVVYPPLKPILSQQPVTFLPGFWGRAEVRFYSRIKRWLHRVSHQPAVRTETAEKQTIPEIPVRFRQSEVAPILGV